METPCYPASLATYPAFLSLLLAMSASTNSVFSSAELANLTINSPVAWSLSSPSESEFYTEIADSILGATIAMNSWEQDYTISSCRPKFKKLTVWRDLQLGIYQHPSLGFFQWCHMWGQEPPASFSSRTPLFRWGQWISTCRYTLEAHCEVARRYWREREQEEWREKERFLQEQRDRELRAFGEAVTEMHR